MFLSVYTRNEDLGRPTYRKLPQVSLLAPVNLLNRHRRALPRRHRTTRAKMAIQSGHQIHGASHIEPSIRQSEHINKMHLHGGASTGPWPRPTGAVRPSEPGAQREVPISLRRGGRGERRNPLSQTTRHFSHRSGFMTHAKSPSNNPSPAPSPCDFQSVRAPPVTPPAIPSDLADPLPSACSDDAPA